MSKKKLLIIAGSIAAFVIVVLAAVKATSQPSFCARCHEIAPAVESWRLYSHSQVECMDCHADPGAIGVVKRKVFAYKELYTHFFTENPQPLEAKVNFENCVLCHSGKRASKYPQAPNLLEGDEDLVQTHSTVLADKANCLNCHLETAHGSG